MATSTPDQLSNEHKAFHAHLDKCEQCRNSPMALCRIGEMLLRLAVGLPIRGLEQQ